MGIVRWEPFPEMMALPEAMDPLFEESVVSPRRREWPPSTCTRPRMSSQ